jgi:hypothetical protein
MKTLVIDEDIFKETVKLQKIKLKKTSHYGLQKMNVCSSIEKYFRAE